VARLASACRERAEQFGIRALSNVELLTILLGPTAGMNSTRDAAQRLLETASISEIAWSSVDELQLNAGVGPAGAAAIAAAFELGRRGAWAPPKRGERILDAYAHGAAVVPARVYELMRPLAQAEREEL
jgi:DNA repair protein RadC